MASDNHANYARIGFVIVLGVFAIIATLVYLGGMRGRGDEIFAETYYDHGVSGLSEGSAVNFRGVKIGEVREIDFVGNKYSVGEKDDHKVYIRMAFGRKIQNFVAAEKTTPEQLISDLVAQGLRATVTASGITGLSRIELNVYPAEKPSERISWHPNYAYIPSKISLLDNFSDSATKVMAQINSMDINSVWSNIAQTVESLARASDSVKNLCEARQSDIDKIIRNFDETAESLRDTANQLRENPSLIIRERHAEPLPETSN